MVSGSDISLARDAHLVILNWSRIAAFPAAILPDGPLAGDGSVSSVKLTTILMGLGTQKAVYHRERRGSKGA
jgi:hypothetical protein